MNEEIVEKIENTVSQIETSENNDAIEKITWLIFSICEKRYAIKSCEVHEIIRDVPVYKLPFLPSYIEGVMNRRGDPFTVINPLAIIDDGENAKIPEQPLFLVLKRDDDQVSLHISDILFFLETEIGDLHLIPSANEEGIFLGTIDFDRTEIPVLNPNAFELLFRKDLGR